MRNRTSLLAAAALAMLSFSGSAETVRVVSEPPRPRPRPSTVGGSIPSGNRCTNWLKHGKGQREALRRFRRAQGGPGIALSSDGIWAAVLTDEQCKAVDETSECTEQA